MKRPRRPIPLLLTIALFSGCASLPDGVEARSLLGEELRAPVLEPDVLVEREADLAEARATYEAEPASETAAIWVGRRLAYLGRYREAIDWYTERLGEHQGSARLHRHRGHRYITVRDFDAAVRDLSRAAELVAGLPDEIEPDGQPNAQNIPRTTTQFSIHYHLGLAHYLSGDYGRALATYRDCLAVSENDDKLVATWHWLYMTLRRLGRHEEALAVLDPIQREMDVIENFAYHRALLFYKGVMDEGEALAGDEAYAQASTGYGIASFYLMEGNEARAVQLMRDIVTQSNWAAFGRIASEADLARMGAGLADA